MELIKSKTYHNLAKSFAGECQARTRYKFIEYGARQQGYTALADVIAKVETNEFNHARMFYTYIQKADVKKIADIEICAGYPFKEKWDLIENLKLASEDEDNEFSRIYPEFAATAREEGFPEIATLFDNVLNVENCHKKLFADLHNQMKKGTIYKKTKATKWKCSDCGHEDTLKEAWKVCPLCEAKQGAVMLILADE